MFFRFKLRVCCLFVLLDCILLCVNQHVMKTPLENMAIWDKIVVSKPCSSNYHPYAVICNEPHLMSQWDHNSVENRHFPSVNTNVSWTTVKRRTHRLMSSGSLQFFNDPEIFDHISVFTIHSFDCGKRHNVNTDHHIFIYIFFKWVN